MRRGNVLRSSACLTDSVRGQELLLRERVAAETLQGRGKSGLAHMLSLIHFGDYVSFYLAMLNGVDPTPVDTIAFLKRRLAEAAAASLLDRAG